VDVTWMAADTQTLKVINATAVINFWML